MRELTNKLQRAIENKLDEILENQRAGREVQAIEILYAADALDCYRRLKAHSETSSGTSKRQSSLSQTEEKPSAATGGDSEVSFERFKNLFNEYEKNSTRDKL